MQFKVIAASLLASAGISMAAPLEPPAEWCPVVDKGDYVWQIDRLEMRKNNGTIIENLRFYVKVTNGGTAEFQCTSPKGVENGKLYQCGENSSIYWAYQDDRAGVLLRQDVSDKIQYVGTTTLPSYCRASGNGFQSFVCQSSYPSYVTLVQYPGKLEALECKEE